MKTIVPIFFLALTVASCRKDNVKDNINDNINDSIKGITDSFIGKHYEKISRTCSGGICYLNNYTDTAWFDTVEIAREGAQIKIDYGYTRTLNLSSFTDDQVTYEFDNNGGSHQSCILVLDAKKDSFFMEDVSGGMAGSLFWRINGKR